MLATPILRGGSARTTRRGTPDPGTLSYGARELAMGARSSRVTYPSTSPAAATTSRPGMDTRPRLANGYGATRRPRSTHEAADLDLPHR